MARKCSKRESILVLPVISHSSPCGQLFLDAFVKCCDIHSNEKMKIRNISKMCKQKVGPHSDGLPTLYSNGRAPFQFCSFVLATFCVLNPCHTSDPLARVTGLAMVTEPSALTATSFASRRECDGEGQRGREWEGAAGRNLWAATTESPRSSHYRQFHLHGG